MIKLPNDFYHYSIEKQTAWTILNGKPDEENQKIGKGPVLLTAEEAGVPAHKYTSDLLGPYYINLRDLEGVLFSDDKGNTVSAFNMICDCLYKKVLGLIEENDFSFDFVISSAEAGIPWGASLARDFDVGLAYMSSKVKKGIGQKPKTVINPLTNDEIEFKPIYGYAAGCTAFYCDDLFTSLKTSAELAGLAKLANIKLLPVATGVFNRKQYPASLEQQLGFKIDALLDVYEFIDQGLEMGLSKESANNMSSYHENHEPYALRIVENNPDWIRDHEKRDDIMKAYEKHNMPSVAKAINEVIK